MRKLGKNLFDYGEQVINVVPLKQVNAYVKEKNEKEELQQRIDKAINYIENDLQSFIYSIEYKTLMKILKGESND